MISLGFNNEFVNPVKEGVKTSTIRKHFNGKIGDKIEAYNADKVILGNLRCKPFGNLKITSIEYIRFDEINKEVARTEGYLHEDILKEELYAIYDDELKDSTLLYYIQFEFIPLEQEDDTDESIEWKINENKNTNKCRGNAAKAKHWKVERIKEGGTRLYPPINEIITGVLCFLMGYSFRAITHTGAINIIINKNEGGDNFED